MHLFSTLSKTLFHLNDVFCLASQFLKYKITCHFVIEYLIIIFIVLICAIRLINFIINSINIMDNKCHNFVLTLTNLNFCFQLSKNLLKKKIINKEILDMLNYQMVYNMINSQIFNFLSSNIYELKVDQCSSKNLSTIYINMSFANL